MELKAFESIFVRKGRVGQEQGLLVLAERGESCLELLPLTIQTDTGVHYLQK